MAASQLDKFVALGSGCYCSAHGSYLLHSWSSLDEANSPIARQLQRVCHDTLPWLISFSLDLKPHVERYFYSKDGSDVQGPIDVDDLRQMRAEGILTSQTQVCMEGTQTWRPIATVAPTVPATPKQIAYLSYTGVADPDRISKDEVAIVLNKLFDTPDLKLWRQLRQKQEDWATDLFILYPDLYAGTSSICSTRSFRVHFMRLSAPEWLGRPRRRFAPKCAPSAAVAHNSMTVPDNCVEQTTWCPQSLQRQPMDRYPNKNQHTLAFAAPNAKNFDDFILCR